MTHHPPTQTSTKPGASTTIAHSKAAALAPIAPGTNRTNTHARPRLPPPLTLRHAGWLLLVLLALLLPRSAHGVNHYTTLGLSRGASMEKIRKAYKSLALKFGAVLGAFGGKSHVVKALPFHMAPGEQTWLMQNTATGETFTYKWRVDDDGLSFAGVQTHYQVMRGEKRECVD